MKSAIKNKLEQLDTRLPRRGLLLLPAETFICRLMELPDNTSAAELPGLVQLQLEAQSPFPVESLAWGLLRDRQSKVLVYAATLERACKGGTAELQKAWHAFPAFLPFCLLPASGGVRLCRSKEAAIAIYTEEASAIPTRVLTRPMPEVEAAPRSALLAVLGLKEEQVQPGLWELAASNCDEESRVRFDLVCRHEGKPEEKATVAICDQALWDADARGPVQNRRLKVERRKDRLIWTAFRCALGAASVLAAVQLVNFGLGLGESWYKGRVKANLKLVESLQNESDFANVLESVTERQTKPFAMLAAANRKRPAALHFERVSTGEWNVLRVEGIAQRANLVQQYIETLGADPDIVEVRNVRTSSTAGRSSFDIEIVFHPLPDLAKAAK